MYFKVKRKELSIADIFARILLVIAIITALTFMCLLLKHWSFY